MQANKLENLLKMSVVISNSRKKNYSISPDYVCNLSNCIEFTFSRAVNTAVEINIDLDNLSDLYYRNFKNSCT